ncbi:CrcB family protein [Streptomyces sp. WAC 00631]|uniref:fluoride efflux transporter FluC n=1 Tax=Streptomyces sp. WAC 00631 TaxID=2203201 RepID=UPI000F77352C
MSGTDAGAGGSAGGDGSAAAPGDRHGPGRPASPSRPGDPGGPGAAPGSRSGPGDRAGAAGATPARRAPRAVDPDVDLRVPEQRAEAAGRALWGILAVVSAGGALGACARYGLTLARPAPHDAAPWAILVVNASGSALIGVLMTLVSERPGVSPHPLLRPFLGTGVLGGFTTFSTYAADVPELLARGETAAALAYAAGTLAAALTGVGAAAVLTRKAVGLHGGAAAETGPEAEAGAGNGTGTGARAR